jgi:Holliday junction resolvase RusA-like endonuclease
MEISIPLRAISINEAYQGRRFKTKKCNDYCKDFLKVAPKKNKLKGIVEIEFKFFIKSHGKADYDNLIKITQDLLVECGYVEDDRKIYKATIYKIPAKEEKIEISILPYNLK